jgi:hypothetical protein
MNIGIFFDILENVSSERVEHKAAHDPDHHENGYVWVLPKSSLRKYQGQSTVF